MEIISLVKRQQPRIRGHYNSIRTRSADPPIPDPQIPRSADPNSNLRFEFLAPRFRVVIVLLSSGGTAKAPEMRQKGALAIRNTKYGHIKNMKLKAVHMRRPDKTSTAPGGRQGRPQRGLCGQRRGGSRPILTDNPTQTRPQPPGADCSSIVR